MPMESKPVEIRHLLFDPENPRLPEEAKDDQRQIFRFLVEDIGIEDVINSLASSGLIPADPLIARPAKNAGDYYLIEGNRRLAALKLLTGERIGDEKPEPVVPPISPKVKSTLGTVTIQLGWDREKLEAYLGYKHVTAAREWAPEAKARFVVKHCGGDFSENTLSKFSKRLGTNLPTLRRWLVAYLALKQAEKAGKFNPEEAYAKRYFGTFYTLLGSQNVQEFLGLKSGAIRERPVPPKRLPQLGEFISWAIGTRNAPPIVNSRSQQKFDAVLASPSALQYFRTKKSLEGALLYTEYNSGQIADKLMTAAYTIEECLPKVFDVKDDSKVVAAIQNLERAFEKLRLNTVEQTPVNEKPRK